MPEHDPQARRRGAPDRDAADDQAAPEAAAAAPAHGPLAPAQVLQLQRALGNQAVGRMLVARHAVAATAVDRHSQLDLFGDGTPAHLGMTLAEFERSTRIQADWFTEPSLTATDRDDLWALLRRTTEGPHILAGAGDLRLAELRSASVADWNALSAFGRGCHSGSSTVRILQPAAYTLPQRIALGDTLTALEAVIPPDVLRLTVSELQLSDVQTGGHVPAIAAYWAAFAPHLQRRYEPGPGARGLEFQGILDMIVAGGHAPFAALHGRVRNLHRFSIPMLTQLMVNWADTTRARPVDLVLHTGHDESAFQASAGLFADLILNSPHNVLMLEGQEHITDITAAIPGIAATYGQLDGSGTPRIAQAMIAGHGQTRTVELAGTGAPGVHDEHVAYPSESLDLDTNLANTQALLDTLLGSLDPATARVVFAGCLVGSNPVPPGTSTAAGVAAHIAATPSLGTFTQQRATALGLGAGVTQAARASVGLGAATSLMDVGGNLAIQYPFDPQAFGTAAAYVASGNEPEGLFRAAVEVAATAGPVVAETHLRTRLAAGGTGWWQEITLALVGVALNGVGVGAGVDIARLNTIAHMAGIPFLAAWPGSYGITVGHFVAEVNSQAALAPLVYAGIEATPTFAAAADADRQAMRLIVEQGWMAFGTAREANLLAFLNATPAFTAEMIGRHLDTGAVAARSATLFPAAAGATGGRIRLALAWFQADPANADVRAFLNDQVVTPAGGPELNAAVRAQLGGYTETEILEGLGRLMATTTVAGSGGAPVTLPSANAEILNQGMNRVLIEPDPHDAIVNVPALNVRDRPNMNGSPVGVLHQGDAIRVMGFTHSWAGIDLNGELRFVYRPAITR